MAVKVFCSISLFLINTSTLSNIIHISQPLTHSEFFYFLDLMC